MYNVECMKCEPENIILSNYDENTKTIEMEIEVKGFVKDNPDNIKMKFVCDDESSSSFITDCIYESQSLRDIAMKEAEMAQKFQSQRDEAEKNKADRIEELELKNKEQDEEREKWLAQMEKDRKKKKKQEDIDAFNAELETANIEWEN